MALMMKKPADFFEFRKQQMCQQASMQMNLNPDQVKAFLDNVGVAEENVMHLLQQVNNPGYVNTMKLQ